MSNWRNPEFNEGGQRKAVMTDTESEGLLSQILKQLKIMNIQLAILTDNWIDKGEV